jgi:hypothetical protein
VVEKGFDGAGIEDLVVDFLGEVESGTLCPLATTNTLLYSFLSYD